MRRHFHHTALPLGVASDSRFQLISSIAKYSGEERSFSSIAVIATPVAAQAPNHVTAGIAPPTRCSQSLPIAQAIRPATAMKPQVISPIPVGRLLLARKPISAKKDQISRAK